MTQEEFLALHERCAEHSRRVDTWFVQHAGRSAAKQAALLALLDGRALAQDLLNEVLREALSAQFMQALAVVDSPVAWIH